MQNMELVVVATWDSGWTLPIALKTNVAWGCNAPTSHSRSQILPVVHHIQVAEQTSDILSHCLAGSSGSRNHLNLALLSCLTKYF